LLFVLILEILDYPFDSVGEAVQTVLASNHLLNQFQQDNEDQSFQVLYQFEFLLLGLALGDNRYKEMMFKP
jgi:hypothetical protein